MMLHESDVELFAVELFLFHGCFEIPADLRVGDHRSGDRCRTSHHAEYNMKTSRRNQQAFLSSHLLEPLSPF